MRKRILWAFSASLCIATAGCLGADTPPTSLEQSDWDSGTSLSFVQGGAGSDLTEPKRSLNLKRLLFPNAAEQQAAVANEVQLDRAWLDARLSATGGPEWQCLTEALYFEARGESVKGQFAVAEVIMNRAKSSAFPDTVCGVINQGTGRKYQCQFTYTCDGNAEVVHEQKVHERLGKIARLVLDGNAPTLTDGATHYHTRAVSPNWSRIYPRTASIGSHHFYRMQRRVSLN